MGNKKKKEEKGKIWEIKKKKLVKANTEGTHLGFFPIAIL